MKTKVSKVVGCIPKVGRGAVLMRSHSPPTLKKRELKNTGKCIFIEKMLGFYIAELPKFSFVISIIYLLDS